ncbi:hypothetical protein CMQ_587 [Grosmannia clavigera kw1407]|uniref:Uncharacterized protein n=1 Tax=Grosmannia clavigera (strain kw1407 / UAMH 11150) TaxID=655863 RepID=F0XFU3_GROCL|nr:uncharacterized protein CMQ_587 [Grosmannia clavigera kw1407]EFX03659.1 hypothetical protein CMQ_587 [Grosmannia clavigera kw1407]
MANSGASHTVGAVTGRARVSKKRPATDDFVTALPSAAKRKVIIKVPPSLIAGRHDIKEAQFGGEGVPLKNIGSKKSAFKTGAQPYIKAESIDDEKHGLVDTIDSITTAGASRTATATLEWETYRHCKPPVRIVIVGRWRAAWLASTARRCRKADEVAERAAEDARIERCKAVMAHMYMEYISCDRDSFSIAADKPFLRRLARTHMTDLAIDAIRVYLRENIMNTADYVEMMKWYDSELTEQRERRETVANRDAQEATVN